MLTWLVMHIHAFMFSPITGEAYTFVQALSFMELLLEIALIVIFLFLKFNKKGLLK